MMSTIRLLTATTLFGVVTLAGGAGAEPTESPNGTAVPIHIAGGDVEPTAVRLEDGEAFAFFNDGEGAARVIFDRRAAHDVSCEGTGASRSRAGQFVVRPGARMACTATRDSISYTVFTHQAGSGIEKAKGSVRYQR